MSFLGLCLASKLEKQKEKCASLEKDLASKDSQIGALRERLDVHAEKVKELGKKNVLLEEDIKSLKEDLDMSSKESVNKDNIIIQYGKEVSDLRNKLKESEERCSNVSDNYKILSAKYNKAISMVKVSESNMQKAERVIRFMYESLSDEDKPKMAEELNKNFGIVFATPVTPAVPEESVSSDGEKTEENIREQPAPVVESENEGGDEVADETNAVNGSEEKNVMHSPSLEEFTGAGTSGSDDEKTDEGAECNHGEEGCDKENCCKKTRKNGKKKKK